MDTSQKDAFTDLAESISSNNTPQDSSTQAGSGQVVDSTGGVVTLGQDSSENKAV